MNRLVKAIVFSVSSIFLATSAFAAPQAPYDNPRQPISQAHNNHHMQPVHGAIKPHVQQPQHIQYKNVKPSRDWHTGQKVPPAYYANSYHIDHKKTPRLTKPGKNQQWIKVNGDYILTNTINRTIIKIVRG